MSNMFRKHALSFITYVLYVPGQQRAALVKEHAGRGARAAPVKQAEVLSQQKG